MILNEQELRSLVRNLILENTYPIDTDEEAEDFIMWLMMNYEAKTKKLGIERSTKYNSDKLKKAWSMYGDAYIKSKGGFLGLKNLFAKKGKKIKDIFGSKEAAKEYRKTMKASRNRTPAVIYACDYNPGTKDLVGMIGQKAVDVLQAVIPEGHGGAMFFSPPDANGMSWPTVVEFGRYSGRDSPPCKDLSRNLATTLLHDLYDAGRKVGKAVSNKSDNFPFTMGSSTEKPITNLFRSWYNDTYPEEATEMKLSPSGNVNSYVKTAWEKRGGEFKKFLKKEDPVYHREIKRIEKRKFQGSRDIMTQKVTKKKTRDDVGLVTVGSVRMFEYTDDTVKLVEKGSFYTFEDDQEAFKVVKRVFRKIPAKDPPYRPAKQGVPFVFIDDCNPKKGIQYATEGDMCRPYLLTPGTISRSIAQLMHTSPEAMENCGSFALNAVAKSKGMGFVSALTRPLILSSPEQMGGIALRRFIGRARNPNKKKKSKKSMSKSSQGLPQPRNLKWINVTSVTDSEIKGTLTGSGKAVTYKAGTTAYNNTLKDLKR